MPNLYQTFLALLPPRTLQVATIIETDGDQSTVQLPGGGILTVRGTAAVDTVVFVRDGLIESTASPATIVTGEI